MRGASGFLAAACVTMWAVFAPPVAKSADDIVELVKKVKPDVVMIQSFDANNRPLCQGSGFFIQRKGHLVTNLHIIEGASSATIRTITGKQYPIEGIVAADLLPTWLGSL